MDLKKLHKGLIVPEHLRGVCLIKTPSGGYISDGDGYLSMEGIVGDKRIEAKMLEASRYWLGNDYGQVEWFPGYRKISDDEWDDQQARLLDGKIPDEQDEARQFLENKGKK